jgi:hypothetical protein
MASVIGQVLPMAVGVALSPLPIIAVILIGQRPGAPQRPAFLVGRLLGVAVVRAVEHAVAAPAGASSGGEPATWVSVLKLLLGIGSVLIAVRPWQERPRGQEEPPAPRWIGAIDAFTPVKALGAGSYPV